MEAIVSAIQGLFNLITSLVDIVLFICNFVISTIKDLVYMAELLGEMVLQLPSYLGWLPSVVLTNFMLIISIVVIYKVIGREG